MNYFVNRFLSNPTVVTVVFVGAGFTGYDWWYRNGEGALFFVWAIAASFCINSLDQREDWKRFFGDDPDRLPLYIKVLGYPLLASPMIFIFGGLAMLCLYAVLFGKNVPIDANFLIVFGMFAAPAMQFLRWYGIRRKWYRDRRPIEVASGELPHPKTVPFAAVVAPTVALGSPAIPEAMQRLPSSLLVLVREGAIATRGSMRM